MPRISYSHKVFTYIPKTCYVYFGLVNLATTFPHSNTAQAKSSARFTGYDSGLLTLDLAFGIRRAKGAKRLGVRLGNWLNPEETRSLWQLPYTGTLKGKRDRAILAILLGCGLRRRELADLSLGHSPRRQSVMP